jgi:endonuclease/exonuclease/phosphatase family metal-dependent hydrolase
MLEITVMTFNLRYDNADDARRGLGWKTRRPLVEQILSKHQPDVVGFQEALAHQRLELQTYLSDYHSYGEGRDWQDQGEQCPIFWRNSFRAKAPRTFWLNAGTQPYQLGWDALLPRICSAIDLHVDDGPPLRVFNAHLDHIGARSRREALALIARQLPDLLMGDFNEGGLSAQGLTDARPGTDRESTFHDFTGRLDGERIDYLLVSPAWKVVHSARITESSKASDHFPVLARICRS